MERSIRHSAASIMHAAKLDMRIIQARLRHSSGALTRDTYTSVFEEVDREAAETAAAVVPRAPRPAAGLRSSSLAESEGNRTRQREQETASQTPHE